MSKLDKDQVIASFTEAYTKAHGKAPEIEAKGGWYSVDGGKNMRLAQLDEATAELAGSSAPVAAEKTETVSAKAKPAAKKPAAKKKAAKAKTANPVKAAWQDKIGNSGKMPRGFR